MEILAMASDAGGETSGAGKHTTAPTSIRQTSRVKILNKKYVSSALCATGSKQKLRELEQQLGAIQHKFTQLKAENDIMKDKETMLASAVNQQSVMLHHLAQASMVLLARNSGAGETYEALLEAIKKDMTASEMMGMIGSTNKDDLYTNQVLSSCVTPERLIEFCGITTQQLVQKFSSMAMRLAYLLGTGAQKATFLQQGIEATVDEFTAVVQLSNMVAGQQLWEVAALNMETLQHMVPPKGHWVRVNKKSELTQQQVQQLCTCFKLYSSKRATVIAGIKQRVEQLQLLMATPGTLAAAVAAGGGDAQHSQQQLHPAAAAAAHWPGPQSQVHAQQQQPSAAAAHCAAPLRQVHAQQQQQQQPAAAAAGCTFPPPFSGCQLLQPLASQHAPAAGIAAAAAAEMRYNASQPPVTNQGGSCNDNSSGTVTYCNSSCSRFQQHESAAAAGAAGAGVPRSWSNGSTAAPAAAAAQSAASNVCSSAAPPEQLQLPSDTSLAQQQEQLLKEIAQGVSLLQSLEMFLSFKWINTLNKRQLAQATVEAYPFLAFPASLCEALLETQHEC